jgi:hypothetical protein
MFLSLFHVKHFIAGKLERQSTLPTQMAFLMSCLASDLRTILLCVFFLALAAYAFSSLFSVHPHFDVPCSITCPELESLP